MPRRRRWRTSYGEWNRRYRCSSSHYHEGMKTEEQRRRDAVIHSIGCDMQKWGLDLPIGFKTLASIPRDHPTLLPVSPISASPAAGKTVNFHPFKNSTEKTRGLRLRLGRRHVKHRSTTPVA
jgi:hypothetical protein